MKRELNWKRLLPSPQTLSFVGLMLLCLAVFGILKPAYATPNNLYAIVLSACLSAVLALSMGVVISAGGFDLCIGHTAGFAALMCGYFLRTAGMDSWPAMLLALLMAILIGAVNGFLVSKMGISSFIVTLGMQFVLVGVRQWITAGNSYRASSVFKRYRAGECAGISNLTSFRQRCLRCRLCNAKDGLWAQKHYGANIVASVTAGFRQSCIPS